MAADQYDNIFEAVKGAAGDKKKAAPQNFAAVEKEMRDMLAEIHRMNNDLKRQIDEICEKNGVTIEAVLKHLENPANFSPEAWKEFQKSRANLAEKVKNPSKAPPEKKLSSQERKTKMVGSRKKWIQM